MTAPAAGRPDLAWFTHARLGLFLHFGLYSVAARHEWVMNYERTDPQEYRARYAPVFDPDLFDGPALARTAKEAGARYVVLTAKHHEGFCLWDSALTDHTSVAVAGRDLVRELVDALRAEGLGVGIYYSLLDWDHPDYTIDRHHPLRGAPDAAQRDAGKDMARYRAYLHGQVRELLTGYGPVDYLFFDFTEPAVDPDSGLPGKGPDDWDAAALLAMVREISPGTVVNDRLGIPADLVTPEQYQPDRPLEHDGVPQAWEACQTINGSWGYHRDNHDAKSPDLLVRMLVESVALGGNMLLNVGPTGRGEIAPRDRALLAEVGDWVHRHERSVRGAGAAPFTPPADARYTLRGDRLYLHLFAWPFGQVHLPGLAGRVRFARLLHDGSEVATTVIEPGTAALTMQPAGQPAGTLTLRLPTTRPDVLVPVVELLLDEEVGR